MAQIKIKAGVVGWHDDGQGNTGAVVFKTVDPEVDPINYNTKDHWQPKAVSVLLPTDVLIKSQDTYELNEGVTQTGLSVTIAKDGALAFNDNHVTLFGVGVELTQQEIDGDEPQYIEQTFIITCPEKVTKIQVIKNNGDPQTITAINGVAKFTTEFGTPGDVISFFASKTDNPEITKASNFTVVGIHKVIVDREVKIDNGALVPIKIGVNGLLTHFEATAGIWNEVFDAISGEQFNSLDLPMVYIEKVMA